jgi:CRP-like cAMP-binding protein
MHTAHCAQSRNVQVATNAFLARLRRLGGLREADLEQVEAMCVTRQVGGHADLVKEGSPVNTLHVVLEGWACRYRTLTDGRRQFPALVLAGEVCDLEGLSLDRLDYGVATITPCTVAMVSHEAFRGLLDESQRFREVFRWLLAVDNAVASEWALCLGRRSALERIAHLICELRLRLAASHAGEDKSFIFPLTQEELADAVGLSVVHVNRTLQTLRSAGLIRLENRRLVILNGEALERLCDFKPNYLHLDGARIAAAVERRPAVVS